MIIDGNNAILGRLSSLTAGKLMKGEDVVIVNADKVIITGDPKKIVVKYTERRQRGSPQHGPFFPKQSDMIVRRTIRGMMPYKTNKGRAAMKKLRVYAGVPEEYSNQKMEKSAVKTVKSNYMRVRELAQAIGGNI